MLNLGRVWDIMGHIRFFSEWKALWKETLHKDIPINNVLSLPAGTGPLRPPVAVAVALGGGILGSWNSFRFLYALLVGGNSMIFKYSPRKFGKMIQFDEHKFQMGWNHQLAW